MRPSVLLILPSASYRTTDYVEAAAAIGVDVLVATDGDQTLAEQMGEGLVEVDLADTDGTAAAIVEAGGRRRIDAILAVDDHGAVSAARAARRLGLEHNPPEVVAATRDKAAMRAAIGTAVAQPRWRVLPPGGEAIDAARALGFPVVAKPLTASASVGVSRADDGDSLEQAVGAARRSAAESGGDGTILLEQYVDGPEVSVDGLIHAGGWTTLAIFDKPDPMPGPHFPETIFVTPSRHDPAVVAEIELVAARAAAAIGLTTGPVHAEVRVDGSTVVLLELAARTIGGLCGRALRFGLNDLSLEQLVLRNALGERLRGVRREAAASGVAMLPVPSAGRIIGIHGLAAARAVPHITEVEITAHRGDRVIPLPAAGTYLGFVFARAHRADAVEAALRAATDSIRFDIRP